jgi:NAD(P)-dependent dehydrogenase (short-subunit alcohol dehydrogenase family)
MATDGILPPVMSGQTTKSLQGRTALITGASSGLGRAIALAYAEQGANLVCADITPNPPKNTPILSETLKDVDISTPTVELLNKIHPGEGKDRAMYVHCNVTSASDHEAAVQKCVDIFGRIDIMVNNAGITCESDSDRYLRVHEQPEEWFDKTFAVNAKGVWLGCKYATKQMLAQEPLKGSGGLSTDQLGEDRGWIINMCSIAGLVGFVGSTSYCGSKGAVLQMTKSIALDYAKDRIHVNCISPGFTETAMLESIKSKDADGLGQSTTAVLSSMHPWGRLGRAEDIAKAAVYLAGEGASWVTGHCLVVDGGYTAR